MSIGTAGSCDAIRKRTIGTEPRAKFVEACLVPMRNTTDTRELFDALEDPGLLARVGMSACYSEARTWLDLMKVSAGLAPA